MKVWMGPTKTGGLGWGDLWMVCRTIMYIYICMIIYDYILYMFF